MTQVHWKLFRLFMLAVCIHVALVVTLVGGSLALGFATLKQLSTNEMFGAGVGNIGSICVLCGWLVEYASDTDEALISFRKHLGGESGDVGMSHAAKLKYGYPIFFLFLFFLVFRAMASVR